MTQNRFGKAKAKQNEHAEALHNETLEEESIDQIDFAYTRKSQPEFTLPPLNTVLPHTSRKDTSRKSHRLGDNVFQAQTPVESFAESGPLLGEDELVDRERSDIERRAQGLLPRYSSGCDRGRNEYGGFGPHTNRNNTAKAKVVSTLRKLSVSGSQPPSLSSLGQSLTGERRRTWHGYLGALILSYTWRPQSQQQQPPPSTRPSLGDTGRTQVAEATEVTESAENIDSVADIETAEGLRHRPTLTDSFSFRTPQYETGATTEAVEDEIAPSQQVERRASSSATIAGNQSQRRLSLLRDNPLRSRQDSTLETPATAARTFDGLRGPEDRPPPGARARAVAGHPPRRSTGTADAAPKYDPQVGPSTGDGYMARMRGSSGR